MLVFSLVTGLRDMIGGYDVYIYGENFDGLSLKDFSDGTYLSKLIFERGYIVYCYLVHFITDNRYIFFLMTAIISYVLVFKSIKLCEQFILFSLFIFFSKFFLMSFVYVRQFLAMGIVWLAIPYLIKRDFFKYSLFVLLAFTIHTSAIIFFPVYFIGNIVIPKRTQILGVVFSILFGVTSVIKPLFSFLGNEFDVEKAVSYGESNAGEINYFYLLESLILVWGIIKFRKQLYANSKSICFTNIAYCYVCMSFITMRDATSLRLIWYFLIGFIYVIPFICSYLRRSRPYLKSIVMIYFTLLFFRILFIWDGGDMIPYKTFLEDGSRNSRWEYREYDYNYKSNKFYKW